MRNLLRNTAAFYYANLTGKEAVLDENGFETGQYKNIYTEPCLANASISPSRGGAEADMFGQSAQYDRVISTVEKLPITEQSVIWLGIELSEPYNYTVERVAEGLCQNLYAIKAVV